jgi:hypothetical protein
MEKSGYEDLNVTGVKNRQVMASDRNGGRLYQKRRSRTDCSVSEEEKEEGRKHKF